MTYTGDVTPGGRTDVRTLPGLTIRKMSISTMHNNVYLVTCNATGEQLLIDAADDPQRCLALVTEGTGRLDHLVTTHRHWDHTRALVDVAAATGARTWAGDLDAPALPLAPDVLLRDGDTVRFGALANVEPSAGLLAFGAVVVLTMLASSSFDPRLIWATDD